MKFSVRLPLLSCLLLLVRTGLAQRFQNDPEAALTTLRGTGEDLSRDRLFALAELSFVHSCQI